VAAVHGGCRRCVSILIGECATQHLFFSSSSSSSSSSMSSDAATSSPEGKSSEL